MTKLPSPFDIQHETMWQFFTNASGRCGSQSNELDLIDSRPKRRMSKETLSTSVLGVVMRCNVYLEDKHRASAVR